MIPVVEVWWKDTIQTSSWQKSKEINATGFDCRSIGFLIRETDDAVIIALSVTDEDREENEQFNGIAMIPKCCIMKIIRRKR